MLILVIQKFKSPLHRSSYFYGAKLSGDWKGINREKEKILEVHQ